MDKHKNLISQVDVQTLERDGLPGRKINEDFFIYQGTGAEVSAVPELLRLDTLGICYVEKGVYQARNNEHDYSVNAGQLLVLPPNCYLSDIRFSEDFYGTIIFASVDLLSGILDAVSVIHRLETLTSKAEFTLSDNMRKLIESYCRLFECRMDFLDEMEGPRIGMLIGRAFLCDIFHTVIPRSVVTEMTTPAVSRSRYIYQAFINLLVSTTEKPHKTEWYAERLNISPKYLSIICRRESGKTARERIIQYVMNDIRRYLINTDLSVKEIAGRTGYDDVSVFCRDVKRHFGMTALSLRNSYDKKINRLYPSSSKC